MHRMLLVEEDDDLVEFVTRFFSDRFDVRRVPTLQEASIALRDQGARILFADISSHAPNDLSIVEEIRRDHANTRIVLTYLTPPNCEGWSKRAGECADVLMRKPYGLVDIDKIIRGWHTTDGV